MFYLSNTTGDNICIYKDDGNTKIIKITDKQDNDVKVDNVYDFVKEKDMKRLTKNMNSKDLMLLEKAIRLDIRPLDEYMSQSYDIIKTLMSDKMHKEMTSNRGDYGIYPKRNDIVYLIGSTGSGKSTSIKFYLLEFKKLYPQIKKFYLFTDNIEEDEVLKGLDIKRIKLDDQIHLNPIKPIELKDSVCIFDDIDSIQDKKILNAIIALKNGVCKQGVSKCGITCIMTNHNATDGLSCKSSINEAKFIVLYPQGGSTGLHYLLRTKLGLSKEQYMKITQLNSRVVILHKRYPFYVIHSHGIFLL